MVSLLSPEWHCSLFSLKKRSIKACAKKICRLYKHKIISIDNRSLKVKPQRKNEIKVNSMSMATRKPQKCRKNSSCCYIVLHLFQFWNWYLLVLNMTLMCQTWICKVKKSFMFWKHNPWQVFFMYVCVWHECVNLRNQLCFGFFDFILKLLKI